MIEVLKLALVIEEFDSNNESLPLELLKPIAETLRALAQRTWVGIEGEEIRNLWEKATKPDRSTMTMVTSFAKSIDAKLKQKNGFAEENNNG